ncbi:MAG: recO [Ignavibacteria bacterium]|nr:recO [Ignavibacteria bacterium]
MIEKTEGIVIRTKKYGDTSKIVTIFTRRFGLCSFIAKGARQVKSKFGGALELLSVCEISFYKKPHTSLYLLSSADIQHPMRKLYTSSEHLEVGLFIAESLLQTQDEGAIHHELFDFIQTCVLHLDELPSNPFAEFVSYNFFLADEMGFGMDFASADEISGDNKKFFSIHDGIFVDLPPQTYAKENIFVLSKQAFDFLKSVTKSDITNRLDLSLNKQIKKEILDFFTSYFTFHLEKRIFYKGLD